MIRNEEVVNGFLRRGILVFIILLLVSPSFATLIIDDIQITLSSSTWYKGATKTFQLNLVGTNNPAMIAVGLISLLGTANYDYGFNGTITITPSSLLEDQTAQNGGWAKGKFAGGSTLTITGSLWNVATPSIKIINNATIITALMPSDAWYLEELVSPPAPANRVRGSGSFSPIGGGLYQGNNSEGLVLYNFRADYTFASVSPVITNFNTTSYTCSSPKIQIVPEPASLSLFCITALLFAYKRK